MKQQEGNYVIIFQEKSCKIRRSCKWQNYESIPENEVLTAPADGEITVVMDGSFHAVGMRLDNGVELLLHIGVDTVGMNGEGFKPYVTVGDKVKTGDNLIGFSKSAIAAHGLRDVTMLIVTNGDECPPVKLMSGMDAVAGETVVAEM